MEPDALGWNLVLQSWIADTPPVINAWLKNFLYESLFQRFCDPIIHWSHREDVQYRDVKVAKDMDELDLRAQLEVAEHSHFTKRVLFRTKQRR
ncbi:unnamed protein product [Heterotrigona itama]|uniref:Uncharacterized protein n=1 Tax=Heterotrigona itama TaxID=395501 RepID=A0A6V7H9P8_9HYME|nr:unnamed protein product [Heterotrigona itama]